MAIPHFTKRIAAIDLGTNSFHVVIVDIYSDASFRRIDDLKEMVELARGGIGKKLSKGAFERGLSALKKIKILCDSYEVDQILAYATSAIREAQNGGDFIQASIDETGIKINAIPGIVEAELIGYAVQHGLNLGEAPVLGVDIGGGSVEFILMNNQQFHHLMSRKLGVSRMNDQFKPQDPIRESDIQALEEFYAQELKELDAVLAEMPTKTIIGSSGTMQAIGVMIATRKGISVDVSLNELTYSKADFLDFYASFIGLSQKERAKVPGMDIKRLNFINTGVVLVRWLMEHYEIDEVKISTQALREGIIIRHIKADLKHKVIEEEIRDPRRRSVFELLRKCNWHETHSRHVTSLALTLFDRLAELLELVPSDRELLEYASLMHDIGYHISHTAHHKHALYLIKNAELRGFNQDEIEVMAQVARYHRRSTPKKRHLEFWSLDENMKDRIKKLSGILRVVDGLDRSHYQNVQELLVAITSSKIILTISTIDEPQLEIWGATRKAQLLETVANRKIEIVEK